MKITKENYEAYYLDFLENNISNEDALLLREFLALNNDLIEEEDKFLFLAEENMEFNNKSDLKQHDLKASIIDSSNVEYFLIAQKENLLTIEKNNELNSFIQDNQVLNNDKKYFALTSLQPDSRVVFGNKNALKQKESVALWPWLSGLAVAAAVIFLIQIIPSNQSSGIYTSNELHLNEIENLKPIEYSFDYSNKSIAQANFTHDSLTRPTIKNNIIDDNRPSLVASQNQGKRTILKSDRKSELKMLKREELPVILDYDFSIPENTLAAISPSEMNNPLRPITDVVGKIIKTDVDYGVENSAISGKRLYFKIGKLEVLRKS